MLEHELVKIGKDGIVINSSRLPMLKLSDSLIRQGYVLLSVHKRMSIMVGTMTIRNVGETFKDVFNITGFTEF